MTATAASKTPPGPQGTLLFGNLQEFRRDPLQLLMDVRRDFGDVAKIRLGLQELYVLNHPDHIMHVLVDRDRKYGKSRLDLGALVPIVGQGLLTSEGEMWKQQRRMLQPLFAQQMLADYSQGVTDLTGEFVAQLDRNARSGQPLDFAEALTGLTMKIITRSMFGLDFGDANHELVEAIEFLVAYVNSYYESLFPLPEWVPTPSNLHFHRAIAVLDQTMHALIDQRRHRDLTKKDLLSVMMRAVDDETGQGMTETVLRDQVLTIFLAGHETTARSLAWTFYLLSKHPEVERRLTAEVRAVLGDAVPTFANVGKLEYGKMVIQEAMRLYPAVWMMGRRAVMEDDIAGYRIPADTEVAFSQYVMHRHPAYWENPEGFDPERFNAARSAGRPHGVYFPFGAGPRVCIGNTFALLEMALIIPMVLQKYRLDLLPGHPVVPKTSVTLRPLHGLQMLVQPQEK